MPSLHFLPGASGSAGFWRAAGDMLPGDWEKTYLSWPGLGEEPHDPQVSSFDDLAGRTLAAITRPTVLIAQSMGAVVALQVVLERPEMVSCLVLVAASGGMDMRRFGAVDWRGDFRARFPGSAPWVFEHAPDLTGRLPEIAVPTLLLWGEADAISPPAAGRALLGLLPRARLILIAGGGHAMANTHPAQVAPHIEGFVREHAP